MTPGLWAVVLGLGGCVAQQLIYLPLVRRVQPEDRVAFSRKIYFALLPGVLVAASFIDVSAGLAPTDGVLVAGVLFGLFSVLCPSFYFMVDHSVRVRISTELVKAPGCRLSESEIRKRYDPDGAVQRRIQKMVTSGYVFREAERYRVTEKGRRMLGLVVALKRLLKVPF